MSVKNFLSSEEEKKILEAISLAEKNTSGEIRVHLESKCNINVMDRAKLVFNKLKMHKTQQRNGVLFYVATETHHFAILGDKGIDQKVPSDFWESTKNIVLDFFKKENYAEGLEKGILEAGEQLKKYFPYQKDDINELSDEISVGK